MTDKTPGAPFVGYQHLHGPILDRMRAGATSEAIAQWLLEAHGITMQPRAVRKMLKRLRDKTGEKARGVVADALAPRLESDLQRLDEAARRMDKLSARFAKRTHERLDLADLAIEQQDKETTVHHEEAATQSALSAVRATAQLSRIVAVRLHLQGVETPGSGTVKAGVVLLPSEDGD